MRSYSMVTQAMSADHAAVVMDEMWLSTLPTADEISMEDRTTSRCAAVQGFLSDQSFLLTASWP